jgi:biopolymer transport protein ExbD
MPIANKSYLLILIALGTVSAAQAQPKQKLEDAKPVVVSVDANGRFKLGERSMTSIQLGRALKTAMAKRTPDDRIIYINAGETVAFSPVSKLLKLGRSIGQDRFGLMLDDGNGDDTSNAVITKIPGPPSRVVKPNPLYLALAFQKDGGLTLNGEAHSAGSLQNQLQDIFKDRADNGVFVEGTNEIDKTVFLVPSATTKFGTLVQTARMVRDAGAEPIGIEIEGPRPPLVLKTITDLP